MARYYKKKDSSIKLRSWQDFTAASIVTFILLVVFVPALTSGNAIFKPIAVLFQNIGLLFSFVFGLFAFFGYLKSQKPKAPPPLEWGLQKPIINKTTQDQLNRIYASAVTATASEKPTEWTLEALRSIEWKRFEELAAAYYRAKGLRAETQACGPDGGVDVWLYPPTTEVAIGIVQCKAWNSRLVGVKPIREFLGTMVHEKVARGFFMASGEFTADAKTFAESHKITLITGEKFLQVLLMQPPEVQQSLLATATEGDYRTPTCASCGIKTIRRESGKGPFWGCSNYPRCKTKFAIS